MDYGVYDLDFTSEGRRRVYLFSYLLGYSRRGYLHFVEAQDFPTTIREHVRAFEHLQGVAATCLYDNQKVVVLRHDDDGPIYNPRFLAFATHYGFKPWACKPHRPQTKGKVEKPFHYVETNLLNGRTFVTLAQLNDFTQQWQATVADVRIHRETKETPLARHAREVPHLIPLPAQPYDTACVLYRTVNAEGFIAYRQNFYSVPWCYIGRLLPVRITEDQVLIYGPNLEESPSMPCCRGHAQLRGRFVPVIIPWRTPNNAMLCCKSALPNWVRWPVASSTNWSATSARANTRPSTSWPCWPVMSGRTGWPPWSVPAVSAPIPWRPSNASWPPAPDPKAS